MHLKVFVKLKQALKTLSSGQKNPKNPKKPKKPKNNKIKPKNPLGWVFSNPVLTPLIFHYPLSLRPKSI